jgi:hypothetical protein
VPPDLVVTAGSLRRVFISSTNNHAVMRDLFIDRAAAAMDPVLLIAAIRRRSSRLSHSRDVQSYLSWSERHRNTERPTDLMGSGLALSFLEGD